jgi:hypothetical protein
VGLTLEGIHTNWVTNAALLSQGWEFHEGDLDTYVADFAQRRYGSENAALGRAWAHLANFSEVSVYNGPRGAYFASWGNTRSLVTRRPFWAGGSATDWGSGENDGDSAGFMGDAPRYNPKQLLKALRALLAAAKAEPALQQSRSLKVDVVDLCTTTMANVDEGDRVILHSRSFPARIAILRINDTMWQVLMTLDRPRLGECLHPPDHRAHLTDQRNDDQRLRPGRQPDCGRDDQRDRGDGPTAGVRPELSAWLLDNGRQELGHQ